MTLMADSNALARENIAELYHLPLLDLVFKAAQVHRDHHNPREIQCSTLISIKTGACPEDCAYCSQSAHNKTNLEKEKLIDIEKVLKEAKAAQSGGADRFCMGAAWRSVKDNNDFERVLEMIRGVKSLGMETCATLGMVTQKQAIKLKEAGLDYYNHNLDTSPEYYEKVITTRTYEDRLGTLSVVRNSGMKVCCGGILGMGESEEDRIGLIQQLANQSPPPESVPINILVPIEGTPLADTPILHWSELVRTVATSRILMPKSMVRLSAGRTELSDEAQAMCFLAGANSIFLGDELLTTANRSKNSDQALFKLLDLEGIQEVENHTIEV